MKSFEALLAELQAPLDAVWAAIAQEARGRTLTRVLFVAPERRAGTTTIAAAAAYGLARNLRARVALVETDVERPGLAKLVGLAPENGFADVLEGRTTIDACRRPAPGVADLSIVHAGKGRAPLPGELAGETARDALKQLGQGQRFLVVDAPPLVERADARMLFDAVDGAVLVLRARGSERTEAKQALEILRDARVPVLGAVLNRYKSDMPFAKRATATADR